MKKNNIRLHHIGVVIPDEETLDDLKGKLDIEEDFRGYVNEYKALCIFMKEPENCVLEFIIPDGGKLSEFNNGRGGIHHMAFEVKNLEEFKKNLDSKGVNFISDYDVKGAGSFKVNFTKPRTSNYILFEFLEKF